MPQPWPRFNTKPLTLINKWVNRRSFALWMLACVHIILLHSFVSEQQNNHISHHMIPLKHIVNSNTVGVNVCWRLITDEGVSGGSYCDCSQCHRIAAWLIKSRRGERCVFTEGSGTPAKVVWTVWQKVTQWKRERLIILLCKKEPQIRLKHQLGHITTHTNRNIQGLPQQKLREKWDLEEVRIEEPQQRERMNVCMFMYVTDGIQFRL